MTVHKDLASGRWFELSLIEQLANIGMDIERCIKWKQKGNQDYSRAAFERALDLLYLTVEDPKNRNRLREILRTREAFIDHFVYDVIFQFKRVAIFQNKAVLSQNITASIYQNNPGNILSLCTMSRIFGKAAC